MNKIYVLILIAALAGCAKSGVNPKQNSGTYSAAFALSKSNVYLSDPLTVTATSTTATTFDWDFGDGSAHGSGAMASHSYTRAGVYTVTLKIGTSSTSQHVKVFPGQFSYQIKNSLDRDITNYQVRVLDVSNSNEYFTSGNVLAKGSTTDTIFVSLIDSKAQSQILVDGTIYSTKGNALQVGTGAQYIAAKHNYFEITSSTMCNLYGTNGTVPLPNSAVSFASAIANY